MCWLRKLLYLRLHDVYRFLYSPPLTPSPLPSHHFNRFLWLNVSSSSAANLWVFDRGAGETACVIIFTVCFKPPEGFVVNKMRDLISWRNWNKMAKSISSLCDLTAVTLEDLRTLCHTPVMCSVCRRSSPPTIMFMRSFGSILQTSLSSRDYPASFSIVQFSLAKLVCCLGYQPLQLTWMDANQFTFLGRFLLFFFLSTPPHQHIYFSIAILL